MSTGTTVGVALAATLALVGVMSGMSWRWSWAAFAAAAALAAVVSWTLLPRGVDLADGQPPPAPSRRSDLDGLRWPLTAAVSFGATSSIYLAFAAVSAGSLVTAATLAGAANRVRSEEDASATGPAEA